MESMEARTRQYKERQNAKALAHREARERAEPLLTIMKATSQGQKFIRWLLEKCASLTDTTGTRELLMSMETHSHIEWQCLNLRKQRKHLPTQLGKRWSHRTHPRLGSGRGSLNTHGVHFYLLQRAYSTCATT
eukprot:386069-Pleurochrysis_carterae.AAC.1